VATTSLVRRRPLLVFSLGVLQPSLDDSGGGGQVVGRQPGRRLHVAQQHAAGTVAV